MVFVTADSVKGIIEVKTRVSRSGLRQVVNKLGNNCAFIHRPLVQRFRPYIGLFAYDSDLGIHDWRRVLNTLRLAASGDEERTVNHLSLGDSFFIKYWDVDERPRWHAYELRNRAPAYFINNLIHMVAEHSVALNQSIWFPSDGKEANFIGEMPLRLQGD